MDHSRQVCVALTLDWEHQGIRYRDTTVVNRIDFRRDLFPGGLGEQLECSEAGSLYSQPLIPGEWLPACAADQLRLIDRRRFRRRFGRATLNPVVGRFYPRGVIADAIGGFTGDRTPFRLVDADDIHYRVDLNHPLSGYDLTFSAQTLAFLSGREERDGSCNDLVDLAGARGPLHAGPVESTRLQRHSGSSLVANGPARGCALLSPASPGPAYR